MSNWLKNTRGEWYVIAQAIIFGIVVLGPRTWPGLPDWPAPWNTLANVVGVALMAAGGLLGGVAVFHLGPNLTAVPRPKEEATLVDTGAYSIVRHPIYSGLILAAFGWALFVNGWLTLLYALGLFVFFDIKSRREEQWLREKFAAYADYQRRVKKLIPLVY